MEAPYGAYEELRPITHPTRKLRLIPLIAATYFMVSGGPYGLEDIIGKAGYARGLLMLAIIPFVWSLPTSLMVGELASALPAEGGYYVWTRRALGPFWGFQDAWLSLAASAFDMAIYPVTFVLYLGRVAPAWTAGHRGTAWALLVVVGCLLWNLRGARAVGESSIALFVVLLSPFAVLIGVALWRWHGHGVGTLPELPSSMDLPGAISVALWNYMGWTMLRRWRRRSRIPSGTTRVPWLRPLAWSLSPIFCLCWRSGSPVWGRRSSPPARGRTLPAFWLGRGSVWPWYSAA